ncbi:MAG TPA: hypothetical protein VFA70_11840 [Dehalococcoidia bacterium]|jgi:hypothetical protein|nr:hypothetical protein [Dehalococcoidia bacterium]
MIGINVAPGPADGRPQHLYLYRPGEIALLLRPKYPARVAVSAELDDLTQYALQALFAAIGLPLASDPSELGQARQYRRPPLTVRRGPSAQSVRVLHTVNLSSWFDAADTIASNDDKRVYDAILDVSRAMSGLRQRFKENRGRPLDAGNYVIEAATPNWLFGPLQGW